MTRSRAFRTGLVAVSVLLAAALAWRLDAPPEEQHHAVNIEVLGADCGPGHPRPCEPYTIGDDLLGFAYRPGDFTVRLRVPERDEPLSFTSRSGADGYRLTSADAPADDRRPELWIHGCSFTWGYSVDWDAVYPSLVQAARPDLRVRNYGGVGFGNVQALLQLRRFLETDRRTPPKVAVFAYASFHPERNVAAPVVLRRWGTMDGFRHPRAQLDPAGRLSVTLVPFTDVERPEPGVDEEVATTKAIFTEIAALSKAHGIVPVLAVQSLQTNGGARWEFDTEPVVAHARTLGFRIANLLVDDHAPGMNNMPWDGHPSAAAHREYARKLLDALAAEQL